MTKIISVGCYKLEKKLVIWKSIRNLTARGCKGAEIAQNTRKMSLKNHNLWVYEFETNFMTEISSMGCCKLVKNLASWKSIRNLSVRGCKRAVIAQNTRKILLKNHNLWVYEFETNFMTEISSMVCCKLVKILALWKSIRNLTARGAKWLK